MATHPVQISFQQAAQNATVLDEQEASVVCPIYAAVYPYIAPPYMKLPLDQLWAVEILNVMDRNRASLVLQFGINLDELELLLNRQSTQGVQPMMLYMPVVFFQQLQVLVAQAIATSSFSPAGTPEPHDSIENPLHPPPPPPPPLPSSSVDEVD